jgi:O-antigen ligase
MAATALPAGDSVRRPSPWVLMLPVGIVLALLPPELSLTMLATAAGITVLLCRPRWALYALALTVPYQSLLDVKFEGVSVSITEAVVALLLIGWATHLAAGRLPRPSVTPLVVAVAVLLVALSLSVLAASDLNMAAKELLKWIELAAVYLAGLSLLETRRHRRTLIVWLIAAAASQAVVGLYQSFRGIGPAHFTIVGVAMRAYGTFEQPNPFGGYLGLTLPLAVALAIFGLEAGRTRRLVAGAAGVIFLALALTLSRGAWGAQLVALLLAASLGSRKARHTVLSSGVLAIVVLAAGWPLLPPELSGRLTSVVTSAFDIGGVREATVTPENWAVLERLSQWFAGWQMFRANPILGVGIGNYNAAYDEYRLDQWGMALGHAHNHYLTLAAEAGLLGLLAYVGFWTVAFRSGARALAEARDRVGRAVAIGILGGLAAFAAHNLFDVLFVHGMGVTIGLMLTLLHGIPRGIQEPPHHAVTSSDGDH